MMITQFKHSSKLIDNKNSKTMEMNNKMQLESGKEFHLDRLPMYMGLLMFAVINMH